MLPERVNFCKEYVEHCNDVLELGCGRNPIFYSSDKIDILFFKNLPNFRRADLNKKFSGKRKYDVIIAMELIEHLKDPRQFIAECGKCLVNGGHLIITTPNRHYWKLLFGYVRPGTEDRHLFTANDLYLMLQNKGFEVREIRAQGRLPLPIAGGFMIAARKRGI